MNKAAVASPAPLGAGAARMEELALIVDQGVTRTILTPLSCSMVQAVLPDFYRRKLDERT